MQVRRSIFSIVKSAGAFTIINQILFILCIDVKDKADTVTAYLLTNIARLFYHGLVR